jgi:hypothetical protein
MFRIQVTWSDGIGHIECWLVVSESHNLTRSTQFHSHRVPQDSLSGADCQTQDDNLNFNFMPSRWRGLNSKTCFNSRWSDLAHLNMVVVASWAAARLSSLVRGRGEIEGCRLVSGRPEPSARMCTRDMLTRDWRPSARARRARVSSAHAQLATSFA